MPVSFLALPCQAEQLAEFEGLMAQEKRERLKLLVLILLQVFLEEEQSPCQEKSALPLLLLRCILHL